MSLYIGIDPGLSGAVAALNDNGELISVQDTPVIQVKKAKGKKRVYLPAQMVAILETIAASETVALVSIENVHAMPKQGVTSMFSMGQGFGEWIGIITALRLPIAYLEPAVWKKAMGISSGSDKGASIIRASRLFPKAPLTLAKHDGRADAILIAEFARRNANGQKSF